MPEVEEIQEQFIAFSQEDKYYDLSFDYVPSLYIDALRADWKLLTFEDEATDKDILRFAEQSGHFAFLDEPEEDIYKPDDGDPV